MIYFKAFVLLLALNLIIFVECKKGQHKDGDSASTGEQNDKQVQDTKNKNQLTTTNENNTTVKGLDKTIKGNENNVKLDTSKSNDKEKEAAPNEVNKKNADDKDKNVNGDSPQQNYAGATVDEPSSSNFIVYFVIGCVFVIGGYLLYNRRKKVMGVIVEGWNKPDQRSGRRRGGDGEQVYSRLANDAEDQA